ncbi:heparan-alpha-glucosaminide N-acetyltransferase domain-containing protein [Sphaerisporangium rubeum]|uniref:Putative membrane protein YeiB n=1 Tax=Sphaerisporangium rubeum TaxID=321317 RepID=A0A7X0M8N3_9ACTN|nr:DUF418 domain-containing protein [Sphaerisporangium rubeum]MBB6475790.1 putative membrane protein YeiB [Sphaerisporangium rubeum]
MTEQASPKAPDRLRPLGRLLGLDAVRAIAILAMVYVHVLPTGWLTPILPPAEPGPVLGWLAVNIPSRPMSLFVTCAGVSAALLTGGMKPPSGRDMTLTRRRLAMRSVALLPFALLMDGIGEPILMWYVVWFLMLIPLLRLSVKTLLTIAGVMTVTNPIITLIVLNYAGGFAREFYTYPPVMGFDVLVSPMDWPALLLFYVTHPQMLYALPLLITGLAIGRMNLHVHALRIRMMKLGAIGIAASLVVGWFVATPLGVLRELRPPGSGTPGTADSGPVPWASLLMGPPHQLYALSIPMVVMSISIASFLLGAFLIIMDKQPWQRILWPLAATGSLALTIYVGHFMALIPFGEPPFSFHLFVSFLLFGLIFSTMWRSWARRGPLEWVTHQVLMLTVPYKKKEPAEPAPAVVREQTDQPAQA